MSTDKSQYSKKIINGKEVFIFEDHSTAILPWREVAASLQTTPFLITLDYHTDTMEAFKIFSYWSGKEGEYSGNKPQVASAIKKDLLNSIDKNDAKSVLEILPKLRNDEHIDASIKSGIISHCFVIQFQDHPGTTSLDEERWKEDNKGVSSLFNDIPLPNRPYSYELPEDKIFISPGTCGSFCEQSRHNQVCLRTTYDLAIDDRLLNERWAILEEMDRSSGLNSLNQLPYILDIDLDYFQSKASINPENKKLFYELIQKAEAITIAQEPDYVEALKKEDDLSSDFLLEKMLVHIHEATKVH